MPAVHSRIVFPAIAELEGAPSTVLPTPPTLALQFSNGNATGELACGISVGDVSAFSDARGLVQDFNAPVPPLSLNGSPGPKNIIIHLSWPGLHSYTSSRHNVSLFKNNNRICMGELAGRVCQLVAGFLRDNSRAMEHPGFKISDTGLATSTRLGLSDVFILGLAHVSGQSVYVPVFQVRAA